jgi:hypothetical protein
MSANDVEELSNDTEISRAMSADRCTGQARRRGLRFQPSGLEQTNFEVIRRPQMPAQAQEHPLRPAGSARFDQLQDTGQTAPPSRVRALGPAGEDSQSSEDSEGVHRRDVRTHGLVGAL